MQAVLVVVEKVFQYNTSINNDTNNKPRFWRGYLLQLVLGTANYCLLIFELYSTRSFSQEVGVPLLKNATFSLVSGPPDTVPLYNWP